MRNAVRRSSFDEIVAESPEVFYSGTGALAVGEPLIAWLKSQAAQNSRKRSRLCIHRDPAAAVHEMIIVHHRFTYVRPHRHLSRSETFHRIEGDAFVIFFDAHGGIDGVFELCSKTEAPFYVRIPAGVYHSFVIRSEWLVFAETTSGPFDRSQMQFAAWSPEDTDAGAVETYSAELLRDAQAFLSGTIVRSERQ